MNRGDNRMIEVKHLVKSFGSLTVLKGVTLTVSEKEVVVLLGASGSGKSNLAEMFELSGNL
jgi:polar amino acid transport system ATP-binding protein